MGVGRVTEVVEYLSNKHKLLSSNPRTARKKIQAGYIRHVVRIFVNATMYSSMTIKERKRRTVHQLTA
jgi:intein-encoded DNA endonuclease-like protein